MTIRMKGRLEMGDGRWEVGVNDRTNWMEFRFPSNSLYRVYGRFPVPIITIIFLGQNTESRRTPNPLWHLKLIL